MALYAFDEGGDQDREHTAPDSNLLLFFRSYDHTTETGDTDIDIIGFGRGAALAVSFANKLFELHPDRVVRFMGLFDLVGGFGHFYAGHDLIMPPNVRHCYHAMALDEQRPFFGITRLSQEGQTQPELQEVWFHGMHSDVGGGNGNLTLNSIALNWMYQNARRCGVPISDAAIAFNLSRTNGPPRVDSKVEVGVRRKVRKDDFLHSSVNLKHEGDEAFRSPSFELALVYDDGEIRRTTAATLDVTAPSARANSGSRSPLESGEPNDLSFGISKDPDKEGRSAYYSGVRTRRPVIGKAVAEAFGIEGHSRIREALVRLEENFAAAATRPPQPSMRQHRAPTPPGEREIIVTAATDPQETIVTDFAPQTPYTLHFHVGTPVEENLAQGETTVTDVPTTGLKARWIVTSTTVELLDSPGVKTQHRGNTWRAEFDLDIPTAGESGTINLAVRTTDQKGDLIVTIISSGEQYRCLTVKLAVGAQLEDDVVAIAPAHLNLRTTHEWTTPPEHIAVKVHGPFADITTLRGPSEYGTVEWRGNSAALKNPILGVRKALENVRTSWEKHLNDIDQVDLETRLAGRNWFEHIWPSNGWSQLENFADATHRQAFDKLASEQELRILAKEGHNLFNACFKGSDLLEIIKNLMPGSRVDFNWTERGGGDWVSHVPWALMYLDPLKSTDTVDCERFLGLRFRIGSKSWEPKAPSRALGAPSDVHLLHFLYWGKDPKDEIAIQSSWQRQTFSQWDSQQHFLPPDVAAPDPKTQVLLALESPAPDPAGVLYFYCECSVKDGSEPILQFGDTGQAPNVIRGNEMYQGRLESGPLVFANACLTTSADPLGTNELEAAFFRRDIRAFIGTETRVPITLASHFAWLFFQFFLRKADRDDQPPGVQKPMAAGEALAQARLFLWTQYRNPGGLFYCLVNQYDLYLASDEVVRAMQR